MTPLAIPKIFDTEGALIVVASRTALRASLCMMHQRLRRCDLPGLWYPGSDVVAIITTQPLTLAVPGMAEIHFVSVGPCVSTRIRSLAVARRTGRDIAPTRRLRTRSMTLVTSCMGVKSGRDRERHAAPFHLMAGGATCGGTRSSSHVQRVIESHIETLQLRKSFDRARRRVRVTDRADGAA